LVRGPLIYTPTYYIAVTCSPCVPGPSCWAVSTTAGMDDFLGSFLLDDEGGGEAEPAPEQPRSSQRRPPCPHCGRPGHGCVCALLPATPADRVRSRTHVLVLQHPAERKRALATARSGLAPGSRWLDHGWRSVRTDKQAAYYIWPCQLMPRRRGAGRFLQLGLERCTVAAGRIFEPGRLPELDRALARAAPPHHTLLLYPRPGAVPLAGTGWPEGKIHPVDPKFAS
jgi:hypothetical protein